MNDPICLAESKELLGFIFTFILLERETEKAQVHASWAGEAELKQA